MVEKKDSIKMRHLVSFVSVAVALAAAVVFIPISCDEKGGDKPSPTISEDSYIYKAVMIGPSGYMTITVVAGDSAKSEVGFAIGGVAQPPCKLIDGEVVKKLTIGDKLDSITFVNSRRDTVTISSDGRGKHPRVTVKLADYDGKITVAAFLDEGGDKAVFVYEGQEVVWYGKGEQTDDNIDSKWDYNIITKGDDAKVLKKLVTVGPMSCDKDEDGNAKDSIVFLSGSIGIKGNTGNLVLLIPIDMYKEAIKEVTKKYPDFLPFPIDGIPIPDDIPCEYPFTLSGETIRSNPTKVSSCDTIPICKRVKEPNPGRAYLIGGDRKGYRLAEGDSVIVCTQLKCPPVGLGEEVQLLDENGFPIAFDDSMYYIYREETDKKIFSFTAKKVL